MSDVHPAGPTTAGLTTTGLTAGAPASLVTASPTAGLTTASLVTASPTAGFLIAGAPANLVTASPTGGLVTASATDGFTAALRVPSGASLTTFTIFRYPPGQRLWAFTLMGRARRPLAATAGLGFHRLLGSGSGLGFSLMPDFGRYALLATWSSEQAADDFFAAAPLLAQCREHGAQLWTVKLLTLRSRGAWARVEPFTVHPHELPPGLPRVVLTRASLRLRAMPGFWFRVPAINRSLAAAPGLRLALGVGELPWVRPVTFSMWDDDACLERFAYQGSCHHAGARAALQRRWFREDLFARFAAIASQGRIADPDPLASPDPSGFQLAP